MDTGSRENVEGTEGVKIRSRKRGAASLDAELDQEKPKIDLDRLKTFVRRALELPRDRVRCFLCLVGECPSKQIDEFYTENEIEDHALKIHGFETISCVKKNSIHINPKEKKPVESNGVELNKLVQKEFQKLKPEEKERTVKIRICVKGDCAFKSLQQFGTRDELNAHVSNNHSQPAHDSPESQLIISGLGIAESGERAAYKPEDSDESSAGESSTDESSTEEDEPQISQLRLRDFVRNAVIFMSFPNASCKEWVCLLEECLSKRFEKLYTRKELEDHVEAEHGITTKKALGCLIKFNIHISHDEKATRSDAEILKTVVKIWEGDLHSGHIGICMEEDSIRESVQLISCESIFKHYCDNHITTESTFSSSLFKLRIRVIYDRKMIDEVRAPKAMIGIVRNMSQMVISPEEVGSPAKGPKSEVYLCLAGECADKPIESLQSKDEIIRHVQSAHQVETLSADLIKYRLQISHQKDNTCDRYKGVIQVLSALKTLKQRLRLEGSVHQSNDTDCREPLTNIQMVDFGLCMITDCASKLGNPFDNVKDLESHVINHHIRAKNLVEGKEISYFTVYPLMERIGPFGREQDRQISTDPSGSNADMETLNASVQIVPEIGEESSEEESTDPFRYALHFCLIRECVLDKSPSKLYSEDEIIRHAESEHGIRTLCNELMSYRIYAYYQTPEAYEEVGESTLRLKVLKWLEKMTQSSSDEMSLNIQTEPFGLCLRGTCASNGGRFFETKKELDIHASKNHTGEYIPLHAHALVERKKPSGLKLLSSTAQDPKYLCKISKGEAVPSHETDLCVCALRILRACLDYEQNHEKTSKRPTAQETNNEETEKRRDQIDNLIRDFTDKLSRFTELVQDNPTGEEL